MEKCFSGSTPEEKITEVYIFVRQLGIEPERALIRVFNRSLLPTLRSYGTDRAGIDERDTRPNEGSHEVAFGYVDQLHALGLRLEDGLYAVPLSEWASFCDGLFEVQLLGIADHRIGIAIYDGNVLSDIFDYMSASARRLQGSKSSNEFYYFNDPQHKLKALVGVIFQAPLEIEQEFEKLPNTDTKIVFLQGLVESITRENVHIIEELIYDIRRNISRKLWYQLDDASLLLSQQNAINALAVRAEGREEQFGFLDSFRHLIELIEKYGKRFKGTSVEFILDNINKELSQEGISNEYQQELQELVDYLKEVMEAK